MAGSFDPLKSVHRDVAQLGSALRSGRRGRRFESCHPDYSRATAEFQPSSTQFGAWISPWRYEATIFDIAAAVADEHQGQHVDLRDRQVLQGG